MNNSYPLNIKFIFFSILKKALASTSNVNLRQFSLLNILYLFLFLTYFIILTLATIHLFQVSCFLSPLLISCWLNLFFDNQFSSCITFLFCLFYMLTMYLWKSCLNIPGKSNKTSMTRSPTNLVPRVSWPTKSFNSTNGFFFSTVKTIGKPRDTWGWGWFSSKFWFYIFTANGSYS